MNYYLRIIPAGSVAKVKKYFRYLLPGGHPAAAPDGRAAICVNKGSSMYLILLEKKVHSPIIPIDYLFIWKTRVINQFF